jgi:hypothetical protein
MSYDPQTIDMGASMETLEALDIIDALNEVSDVLAMAGPQVTFLGSRRAALGPIGPLQGVDVYECPRGWFLLLRESGGPHRPAAGGDLAQALGGLGDGAIREEVRRRLQERGCLA